MIFVLVFIIIVFVACNIKIVPQGKTFIIERLGIYKCTWEAGLHLKVPFIERVAKVVDIKEQVLDFPPQPVITKDNVTVKIDSVIFMKVFDPKLYTYGASDPIMGLQQLSATNLRSIVGGMDLDETLNSRDSINAMMLKNLDDATDAWGIRLTRCEVRSITPDKEIQEVMTKQMKAEREKRQTMLEAEAHKEAVVARAEGDKQAKVLAAEAERDAQIALAEGKAKSIKMVYDAEADGIAALNHAGASDSVLRLKTIEAMKDIADGRATKIFIPSDMTGVMNLASAGEVMGIGNAMKTDDSPKKEAPMPRDACITPETGHGGVEAYHTTEAISRNVERTYQGKED